MTTALDNLLELKDQEITRLETENVNLKKEAKRTRFMIRANAMKYGLFLGLVLGVILGLILRLLLDY